MLFDPNLRADWLTVEHADGTFSLNAEIFRHLSFTPASGPAIDLTHSALLTGRVIANEPAAAHAQVVMPAGTNNGLPLVANVRIDEAGNAVGTIEIDGTVIATIAGTGLGLSFSWSNG